MAVGHLSIYPLGMVHQLGSVKPMEHGIDDGCRLGRLCKQTLNRLATADNHKAANIACDCCATRVLVDGLYKKNF